MDIESYNHWVLTRKQGGLEFSKRFRMLCCAGLIEEVGEISGKLKRVFRGDNINVDLEALGKEIGDAYWYFTSLSILSSVDLKDTSTRKESSCFFNENDSFFAVRVLALKASKLSHLMVTEDVSEDLFQDMYTTFDSLAYTVGFTMNQIREMNYIKLQDRVARNMVKGAGDER